jgi:hypothetical protein
MGYKVFKVMALHVKKGQEPTEDCNKMYGPSVDTVFDYLVDALERVKFECEEDGCVFLPLAQEFLERELTLRRKSEAESSLSQTQNYYDEKTGVKERELLEQLRRFRCSTYATVSPLSEWKKYPSSTDDDYSCTLYGVTEAK